MSLELNKSAQIRSPHGDGVRLDRCGQRRFLVTNVSAALLLPDEWFKDSNGYVTLKADSDVVVYFSKSRAAEVVVPVAAADGGTDPRQGWLLRGAEREDHWLDNLNAKSGQDHWYLVAITYDGSPATSVWCYRSSE